MLRSAARQSACPKAVLATHLRQLAPQLPDRAPEWEASEGLVRQVAEQEPAGLERPEPEQPPGLAPVPVVSAALERRAAGRAPIDPPLVARAVCHGCFSGLGRYAGLHRRALPL
jgi:hypothetical protein